MRTWTDSEVEAHLAERSEYVTESGCRIWLGTVTKGRGWGYGMGSVTLRGRFGTNYVHKVAYLLAHGPLPDGTEVDHKCNVRCCFNPAHLQPLTHSKNIEKAAGSCVAANMAKTCCNNGHPLEGENLRVDLTGPRPSRRCRRCHADREAERRERLRAAAWARGPRTAA